MAFAWGQGQGKTVPVYAMKVYGGWEGIAPFILNLGTRWR